MSQKLLSLCICFCLFLSCDKAPLLSPAELDNEQPTTFEVSIDVAQCFNGGSQLFVSMPNPELYGYLWEVNGKAGGHHNQTSGCQCVENATVRVTRLADGLRVNKSIELIASCLSDESSF